MAAHEMLRTTAVNEAKPVSSSCFGHGSTPSGQAHEKDAPDLGLDLGLGWGLGTERWVVL